jgi:hypothetical protein
VGGRGAYAPGAILGRSQKWKICNWIVISNNLLLINMIMLYLYELTDYYNVYLYFNNLLI